MLDFRKYQRDRVDLVKNSVIGMDQYFSYVFGSSAQRGIGLGMVKDGWVILWEASGVVWT